MILTRASKRYISLFLAIFFLCGIIHPFAVHLDFVYCFSSLVFGVLTIIWAITVQRRVVDDRLRLILMLCAACLLFHFFLQILRYDLISNDRITVRRYLWYAMYIPMISQPTLCLFLAVNIYRPKDKPLPIACYLTALLGILLILGVLTNDLHFWAKSFPSGIMIDDKDAKNGWMFYVVNGYIYGLFAFDYSPCQAHSAHSFCHRSNLFCSLSFRNRDSPVRYTPVAHGRYVRLLSYSHLGILYSGRNDTCQYGL